MTAILVCGGRNYHKALIIYARLDAIDAAYNVSVVVHGAQRGADTMADHWAKYRHKECRPYPARWGEYDNAAGNLRNREMLRREFVQLCVAFPGGPGTADMIKLCEASFIPVIKIIDESGTKPIDSRTFFKGR